MTSGSSPPVSPHRQRAPLAPAGGSLPQLFCSTAPLLGVLIYFLISAARRPYDDVYNYDDDVYLEQLVEQRGAMIGLLPMVYTFMGVFILWSCLGVYLLVFVPKRRALVERYAQSVKNGGVVMGNVHYRPKSVWSRTLLCGCFRPEHATVTYAHPDPESVNREMGTTYEIEGDDGPARRRDWLVRRSVTTYRLYSRESVPIVLLPGLPLSGLARDDVEVDAATFRHSEDLSRDRIREVCRWVIFPWIAFTLLGGIFVVTRMSLIDDEVDRPSVGWTVLLISVFGIMPLLAGGGNWLRWRQYKNYKSNSGRVMEGDRTRRLPTPEEEELERDEGGVGMMNICGAPSDKELGIQRYDGDDGASYRSFA